MYAEVSRVEKRKEDKEVNREAARLCKYAQATTKEFSMRELRAAISVLKTGKAPGPDEISNEMLKNLDDTNQAAIDR